MTVMTPGEWGLRRAVLGIYQLFLVDRENKMPSNTIGRLRALKARAAAALLAGPLPPELREQIRLDRKGVPTEDPGLEKAIHGAVQWLCRAQDHSISADGGVAREYSYISGWSSSYPETTGYIIPTLLSYADLTDSSEIRERARRMLDWLVSIQLPCGGFQGGKVDSEPIVPVAFNTGQILLGLA